MKHASFAGKYSGSGIDFYFEWRRNIDCLEKEGIGWYQSCLKYKNIEYKFLLSGSTKTKKHPAGCFFVGGSFP